tara:strand:+ start:8155 stop:8325 length:171 start_codon:yes stop_codon:yes gene_type:complete
MTNKGLVRLSLIDFVFNQDEFLYFSYYKYKRHSKNQILINLRSYNTQAQKEIVGDE